MKKIKKYINRLFEPEGMEFPPEQEGNVEFKLTYNELTIGYLSYEEDEWEFRYAEEFKKQDEIKPIADFPDKEKVYTNTKLWPFFAARIPSAATPYVKRKAEKNNINLKNVIEMLEAFGERSINNPFRLTVV